MNELTKVLEHSSIPDLSVLVRGSGVAYAQEIVAGPHHLSADEPVPVGAPI